MKHSLFFLLALVLLILSACTLTGPKDAGCTVNSECSENEICYFKPGGTVGSCTAQSAEEKPVNNPTPEDTNTAEETPVNPGPTPTPTKNTPTTPENNTEKQEEISTEELTKELDAFVDEITKGL